MARLLGGSLQEGRRLPGLAVILFSGGTLQLEGAVVAVLVDQVARSVWQQDLVALTPCTTFPVEWGLFLSATEFGVQWRGALGIPEARAHGLVDIVALLNLFPSFVIHRLQAD